MQLESDAIVRVRREAVVRAAPEDVGRLLADVARWPRWVPNVAFTSLPETPKAGTVFQWKVNGMHTVSRVDVLDPGAEIGWSSRGFGTWGERLWTFSAVDAGEGTVPVRTRVESIETVNGWITWLLRRTIRKTLELSADLWMEALVERVEAPR
jgi:hypothetical protein